MPSTLWLSCHAGYACRHSGRCCRAGWPLPVDERAVPAIEAAVIGGRLRPSDGGVRWLVESAEAPEGVAGTFRQVGGACVFHRPGPAGRPGTHECGVHATLGHQALPATCQHFPRVCLVDDRGVRVSLSHACPTAAAMLVGTDAPVTIVAGPPAVPGLEVPEGLDVRDQLPPRLSSTVLMDLEAATAWEAHVVSSLAGPGASGPVAPALAALGRDADTLARWRPGGPALSEAIAALDPGTGTAAGAAVAGVPRLDIAAVESAQALVAGACRTPWNWRPLPDDLAGADARFVAPVWHDWAPVVRRYLAARAFGAWIAYQADAARALVAWLDLAAVVLRVEAVRAAAAAGRTLDRAALVEAVGQADLLLVHYADPALLGAAVAPDA